ncbi:Plant self-incompatibility response [Arabidopsis suecica]|uniref:Plant self-incompatibility response n=1 Tax=Arabidopsis suecica TaxID=45249 RepID=A0A8T1YMH3_ARASU|nr:Plant self-incompatibility response [Arabidopsis suecica]
MKVAAIFLASCILFSLIPTHLSHEEPTVAPTEELMFAPMNEPKYCRSRQVFDGSCTDRGSPRMTCFLDFLGARSASEMPKNCNCTPQPNNKRLCECSVICTDCCIHN